MDRGPWSHSDRLFNDDAGVGVMDPATGELTGVIKDYVELAKDCLQGQTLEFDLKGYEYKK